MASSIVHVKKCPFIVFSECRKLIFTQFSRRCQFFIPIQNPICLSLNVLLLLWLTLCHPTALHNGRQKQKSWGNYIHFPEVCCPLLRFAPIHGHMPIWPIQIRHHCSAIATARVNSRSPLHWPIWHSLLPVSTLLLVLLVCGMDLAKGEIW